MIKRKVIELENIGFSNKEDDKWTRVDAAVTLADDDDVELIVTIASVEIAIPVSDLITCLEELGVDVKGWIGDYSRGTRGEGRGAREPHS